MLFLKEMLNNDKTFGYVLPPTPILGIQRDFFEPEVNWHWHLQCLSIFIYPLCALFDWISASTLQQWHFLTFSVNQLLTHYNCIIIIISIWEAPSSFISYLILLILKQGTWSVKRGRHCGRLLHHFQRRKRKGKSWQWEHQIWKWPDQFSDRWWRRLGGQLSRGNDIWRSD